MRRNLLVLILAGLTLMVSASEAFAQRRYGGGGYAGRYYGGGGYYRGGYGGGYYGGGLLGLGLLGGGYYGGGYDGGGLLGGGYYGGFGYSPYSQAYSYGYGPSYYDGASGYSYYSEPETLVPTTQARQSYYPARVQDFVNMTVLVPTTDAQVWFQNKATTQQGRERLFESPPLTPNHSYMYTIKARWMENGKAVTQERQVSVQSGQNITVNFRENPREIAPQPLPVAIPQK